MRWIKKKPLDVALATSQEEFVDLVINRTNFLDDDQSLRLNSIMTMNPRPVIPLGFDKTTGVGYCLVPEAIGLRPQIWLDENDDGEGPETREILHQNYLGVNTNVQPRGPQTSDPKLRSSQKYPKQSTKSTKSDSTSGHGFNFYQLGKLQAFPGKYPKTKEEHVVATHKYKAKLEGGNSKKEKGEYDGRWIDTGFCLVGELNDNGGIKDFWIIYNMFRVDDEGFEHEINDRGWGRLPKQDHEQFSCARMQPKDAFGELEIEVSWVDRIYHPVELVECVRGPQNEILRATVE